MVAHLGPHVCNLKAAFVFVRSVSSRLLYDITARDCEERPRLHVWAQILLPSISPTIFLSLCSLINVPCALWWCIIHQTEWPGSAPHQPPRLHSLTHSFVGCYPERKNIFHLLSAENILWQSNNLFHIPFECLTMSLLKEATKVQKPQGFLCGYFDPAGHHWQVHFNRSSRLLFPLAALYEIRRRFSTRPHQKQTL